MSEQMNPSQQWPAPDEQWLNSYENERAANVLALPESLPARIEAACEDSSFMTTPEVRGAIEGYYTEHYRTASLIERVLDNNLEGLDEVAIKDQIGNHFLQETANELLALAQDPQTRGQALRKAEGFVRFELFNELAVASETIDEPERQYAVQLAERIKQTAIDEGYASQITAYDGKVLELWDKSLCGFSDNGKMRSPQEVAAGSEWTSKKFWDETRYAGQLEFHNTGNFGDINSQHVLRSRTMQVQKTGEVHTQMGRVHTRDGGNMHSNLTHYSETYSPDDYKNQSHLEPGAKERDEKPGTIAIPLAKIIDVAPFARDAQFGIVKLKNTTDKVVIKDAVGRIGEQGEDMGGRHGEDRVFMADYRADHAQDAVNYEVQFGEESYRLITEDELETVYSKQPLGTGQYYADLRVLPYDTRNKMRIFSGNGDLDEKLAAVKTETAVLAKAIADLQQESIDRYPGQVVAPLRGGVIEFIGEAEPSHGRKEYRKIVRHAPLVSTVA